ncbi:MAG: Crp/Fnr family transcriptional regulator [Methyloligellaceae bacterium]
MSQRVDEIDLELVRSTALLGGLRSELLSSLLKESCVQNVVAGDVLFTQDAPVDACYIVFDGWIKVFRLTQVGIEMIVHVFSRGQSFAEAAVFSMGNYPVSAEAVTDSRLLQIPSSALLKSVKNNPEIALSMLESMSRHLHDLVRQIEQLKTKSGIQRVARFFISLCPVDEGSCTIGLPYDKNLIAGRLGIKPESLSRAFVRLRDVGVHVHNYAAEIKSVEELQKYANSERSESWVAKQ